MTNALKFSAGKEAMQQDRQRGREDAEGDDGCFACFTTISRRWFAGQKNRGDSHFQHSDSHSGKDVEFSSQKHLHVAQETEAGHRPAVSRNGSGVPLLGSPLETDGSYFDDGKPGKMNGGTNGNDKNSHCNPGTFSNQKSGNPDDLTEQTREEAHSGVALASQSHKDHKNGHQNGHTEDSMRKNGDEHSHTAHFNSHGSHTSDGSHGHHLHFRQPGKELLRKTSGISVCSAMSSVSGISVDSREDRDGSIPRKSKMLNTKSYFKASQANVLRSASPEQTPHPLLKSNTISDDLRSVSVVAGGHEDGIKTVEDHPDCVLKKKCENEHEALGKLMKTSLRPFCPRYHGLQSVDDTEFMVMQNLLYQMEFPHVMDIKMGQRTFEEKEVTNSKLRMDLLQKMIKADPSAPTEAEKETGITKLRYMQFREKQSSSSELGFRIEAMSNPENEDASLTKEGAKHVCNREQVLKVFNNYIQNRVDVWKAILKRLKQLREKLHNSTWFKTHELVGSSILFVFDKSCDKTTIKEKCGVWMIDFAHVNEAKSELTHRAAWEAGNQEDGYLVGLDNLISIWESVFDDPVTVEIA